MFQDFMKKLLIEILEEQNIEDVSRENLESSLSQIGGSYTLEIEGLEISLTDEAPGLLLYCHIDAISNDGNNEELFKRLLRGNFLGQATQKASLGLDTDGVNVILSHRIPKISSYKEFRYAVEDFVNTACFWKEDLNRNKETIKK